jgi:Pentapeptide repeats (8 copies)
MLPESMSRSVGSVSTGGRFGCDLWFKRPYRVLMTSRPASVESPPRPPRRTRFWGLAPLEVILLVLAGVAVGFAIGVLVESTEATVGATLLGGVLVAVGTFRTIQVTREGQITERLTKATEQLNATHKEGEPEEVLVLGGIYALERIAADSRLDYHPIMEMLTAFVRTRVGLPEGGASKGQDDVPSREHKLPNDVQAALAVLARRSPRRREYRPDLRSTDLRNAKLPHARFQRVILSEADLRWADLRKADLRGADLSETRLRGAQLDGVRIDDHTTWPRERPVGAP